ncbi:hypothetical protein H112_00130 [Trichophyton rubrum D6]|uniref:RING-type domain-containing protein n=4 Tax=Trichophyton TaxID=5550 RepID=A0A178F7X2_TRIRU|nr:uncharacterized protein TERG_08450 [Trichophyton rubrum CBS 118892]EZF27872.1 hypothetical protein H100_00129 [Trichophyton rubrum MR850]EZF46968.1 hypothetical protein H102_00128 [Trichophyton rubrum CBS 100081]EZF57592.1 hypothetical protein H103_00130 [Trichophyton rubrum CBS 288.86]EZF68156.1 hypothetical protein H104_00129 [Trichophyton rubrum CBS 289.86]EZF78863.1 hypothetical protein H105_00119 [Trichophyton soudanense CBS 452.61]EZF89531.1 hypothetical protein H110_00130 [Trichophy
MENDTVDLTGPSPVTTSHSSRGPVPQTLQPSRSRRSASPDFNDNRGKVKRRRLSNRNNRSSTPTAGPSSQSHQAAETMIPGEIESVDLTSVDDSSSLAQVLAKQREDAIIAQKNATNDKEAKSILIAYKCPVCMDVPENATSTICGHLFCHKCIIDSLKYNETRRTLEGAGKGARGNCPVCRKSITVVDNPGPRRNLVPLQFKLITRKKG